MISVINKVTGSDEIIKSIEASGKKISSDDLYAAVMPVAQSFKVKLQQAYISEQHQKTGALVNSIDVFQNRTQRKQGRFIYYVGPRYTGGGKKGSKPSESLRSYGGNAAHLLEFGTIERVSADIANGGQTIGSGKFKRTFGAKHERGAVPAFGTIRRTYDINEQALEAQLENNISDAFDKIMNDAGFEVINT